MAVQGSVAIGVASLLADAGHEIPTALLPSFLTATLGAPAAALDIIEGVADGLAGAARLGGGAIAGNPVRRRASAVSGYTATAVLSAAIGAAGNAVHVGLLVISDAHEGLKAAVRRLLAGASWQRCRVHFNRNVLTRVGKAHGEMVTATIRTSFAQPDANAARTQLRAVADMLADRLPAVADALLDAEADLVAFTTFPKPHWRRIWSTNPLERLNKEIKRRSNVVGIFPNDDVVIRLIGAVLIEQHDEWQVADRRYFSEKSMNPSQPTPPRR